MNKEVSDHESVDTTPAQVGGADMSELGQDGDESFAVDMFTQLDADLDSAGVVEAESGEFAPTPAANELTAPPLSAPSGEAPAAPVTTPQQTSESAVLAAPVVPVVAPADTNALPNQGTPADQQAASTDVPQESPIEVFRREVEKNRDVFTDALSSTVYKLSDEELDNIQIDPGVAIPKLLAKAHVNIVQNVLGTIAQQLPAAIRGYTQAERVQTEMEDKFFQSWPQLDRTADKGTVLQFAAAYRKANPQASFEEMSRVVGAQAVVALNKVQAAAPAQAAPARKSAGAQAFAPAASGSRAPAPAANVNIWDGIAANLVDEYD